MNEHLKIAIENYKHRGTKLDAKISNFLLAGGEFRNIQELSDLVGTANSTILRYTRKLGYKSFKIFYYNYISDEKGESLQTHIGVKENIYTYFYKWDENKIREIADVLKGKIYVITSRRSQATSYFINERLDAVKWDNEIFHDGEDNLEEFIKKIGENDSLFLLSVSGYSNIIEKTLFELAKKTKEKLPTIISISNKRWIKAWQKYENFYHYQLPDAEDNNQWDEYNSIAIEILLIVSRIFEFSKKPKDVSINSSNQK